MQVTTTLRKIVGLVNHKVKVIQGGQGAGKTIAILMLFIDIALRRERQIQNAKTKGLKSLTPLRMAVVTDSYPNLEKGAIRDFKKIMQALNRWSLGKWHDTKHRYTFPNGTFIEFFSLDKDTSGLGARRDYLYVNEANRVDFKTYNFIAGRTHKAIYIDFNPLERFWVHTELVEREACDFTTVTYKDNEFLPQAEIDFIEEKFEWAKDSEYWYNWVQIFAYGKTGTIVEGTLYATSFSRRKHVGKTEMDFGKLFLAFDFNVNPMTCTLIESQRLKDGTDQVQIHAELEVPNSDLYNFCKKIKIAFAPYLHRIFITGDPAGYNRSVQSRGLLNSYEIIQQELDLPSSVLLAPESHLTHLAYRQLLNLALAKLDITISPDCESLIYDLEHITIGKNHKPIKHKRDDTGMDLLDGVLYFIQTEYHHILIPYTA